MFIIADLYVADNFALVLRFYLSKAGEMLVVHEFRVTGSRIQGGIWAYLEPI